MPITVLFSSTAPPLVLWVELPAITPTLLPPEIFPPSSTVRFLIVALFILPNNPTFVVAVLFICRPLIVKLFPSIVPVKLLIGCQLLKDDKSIFAPKIKEPPRFRRIESN